MLLRYRRYRRYRRLLGRYRRYRRYRRYHGTYGTEVALRHTFARATRRSRDKLGPEDKDLRIRITIRVQIYGSSRLQSPIFGDSRPNLQSALVATPTANARPGYVGQ